MTKNGEIKIDEQLQYFRRNLNRKDIQERLKKASLAIPTIQKEERKDCNEKKDCKCKKSKFKKQMLAYVTNIDSVSVVDILAGKEITQIPLDSAPLDVAISPDKRYVYVTFPDDATLGVIAVSNNSVIAIVNLNEPPFISSVPLGVAVSPNGRYIYTANNGTSNVSIVEVTKYGWRVIGEIPLTKKPQRIAITPDGRLAYITLRDDNAIAVADLLVNLPIDESIAAGTRPIDIAINKAFLGLAANPGSDDVTVFNAKLAKSSPISIPVGDTPPGVAFNPRGTKAYVTNRSGNSVSVIRIFQHQVIDTIPVGQEPIGVAVTEDGRFTVVANSLDNTISIIDNVKRQVIDTVGVGVEPFFVETVTVRKNY